MMGFGPVHIERFEASYERWDADRRMSRERAKPRPKRWGECPWWEPCGCGPEDPFPDLTEIAYHGTMTSEEELDGWKRWWRITHGWRYL